MYSTKGGLTLAFHGCDERVATAVISGREMLKGSQNSYDWLGNGIYFWENSPSRAMHFAQEQAMRIQDANFKPAVIGAVIDLGFCLQLFDLVNLRFLKDAYEILVDSRQDSGLDLPRNRRPSAENDLLLRDLDCAVIEMLHYSRSLIGERPFDSIRGAFQEGKELYPGAGFREKDHIQICVRNPNCVKGLFIPRREDHRHPTV